MFGRSRGEEVEGTIREVLKSLYAHGNGFLSYSYIVTVVTDEGEKYRGRKGMGTMARILGLDGHVPDVGQRVAVRFGRDGKEGYRPITKIELL